jgi:preprotein translocase subunit SecB
MADNANNANGPAQGAAAPNVQVRVVSQYIKDLSFENPNIERLLGGPGDNPNLRLEINVNAKKMGDDLYESAVEFKGNASSNAGAIYEVELVYAGLFQVQNMPAQALEPFLLINCPSLMFPFIRRILADLTREGGFPPLFLDPIDFGALYVQRQKQAEPTTKTIA